MSEFAEFARLGRRALKAGERAVLAQVVQVDGSHYRRPGARMVLTESGESAGSISPGCLEVDLARHLPDVWESGRARSVEYDSRASQDLVWGFGSGCGGKVTILVTPLGEEVVSGLEGIDRRLERGETIRLATSGAIGEEIVEILEPPIRLLVCGAGSDVPPLLRQAALLAWSAEVYAPRPSAAAVRLADLAPGGVHAAEELEPPGRFVRAAAVVMTHNFLDDLTFLERLLPMEIAYVAVLGSRERTVRLLRALEQERALPAAFGRRLYSPAGLDLGAERPQEIALAIVAEIQAVLQGRAARSLRKRGAPIHDDTSEGPAYGVKARRAT